jgi:hypothetical protein
MRDKIVNGNSDTISGFHRFEGVAKQIPIKGIYNLQNLPLAKTASVWRKKWFMVN